MQKEAERCGRLSIKIAMVSEYEENIRIGRALTAMAMMA